MRWSIRLARIAGIDVKIHATFLILLAWIAWSQYSATGSARAALGGLLSLLLVFGSVLLHEYGHALVARRFGISTRDITLLPIGGVAALERMPEDPKAEIAVSIAGPAVNGLIALVAWLLLRVLGRFDLPPHPLLPGASVLETLVWINIMLGLFNLVPAFPMDGGRVLRSALALRLGHARATQLAANLGQAFAILAGIVGLFWNPLLLFVALFVWLGAAEESRATLLDAAMAGIAVEAAMARDVRVVSPSDPVQLAVQHLLDGHQQDLPVVEGGRVVGVLTRTRLLKAVAEAGLEAPVAEVMQTNFDAAHPADMLSGANARMRKSDCDSMPVVTADGRVVGMLTRDSIGDLLLLRAALLERQHAGD